MRKDGGLNQYEEGRGGKHIKKKTKIFSRLC